MGRKCIWIGHDKVHSDGYHQVCETCGLHSYFDDPDNESTYPTGHNFYDSARLYRPLWAMRAIWREIKESVKDRIWRWRNPDLPF